MKEYFYTNTQLALILKTNSQNQINWEENGFNVNDVIKYQDCVSIKDGIRYLLPITNKQKFNMALGNLITIGQDGEYFYKVITEEQAQIKKQEFAKIREQQKLEQEQKQNKNNAEIDELQDVVDSLAMENLKMKGVIQ